ncbi:hypothetical protein Pmani_025954 [Petrolisthes manimaculis]|uniref:Sulfotransferase n=1 Tax=Petrolisthes manimaculis TaxID=1843537 RepID=A0AAE1U0L7_9EUCA|nr:hypothetical protein Pmani_025954 [Petrolisthes manimaculis]
MFGPGRIKRTLWMMLVLVAVYIIGHVVMLTIDYSETNINTAIAQVKNLGMNQQQQQQQQQHNDRQQVKSLGTIYSSIPKPVLPPVLSSTSSPLLVLVLSSMPRSGSTFLTELLTNVGNSITFYEPLWILQKKPQCNSDSHCVSKFLEEIFTCSFDEHFENWLKSKALFFQYFSADAKACTEMSDKKGKKDCAKRLNLKHDCELAQIRFMKVIRARLGWMESLLEDPTVNLKIIHLARDPRGSINSIRKFKWDNEPLSRCSDLENDMDSFDSFQERFPSKVIQVNYEELCTHPIEVTSNMLGFITGDSSVPDNIRHFLTNHTTNSVSNHVMSTFKESKKQFEAWRYQIPASLLKNVENEPTCLSSIKRLHHTVFGSKENVVNSSIPLLLGGD